MVSTPIDIACPTFNELNVVLYLTTPSYKEFAIYTVCSSFVIPLLLVLDISIRSSAKNIPLKVTLPSLTPSSVFCNLTLSAAMNSANKRGGAPLFYSPSEPKRGGEVQSQPHLYIVVEIHRLDQL